MHDSITHLAHLEATPTSSALQEQPCWGLRLGCKAFFVRVCFFLAEKAHTSHFIFKIVRRTDAAQTNRTLLQSSRSAGIIVILPHHPTGEPVGGGGAIQLDLHILAKLLYVFSSLLIEGLKF